MSAVEDRLAALGLVVPELTPPLAAYLPAVRDGRHVYVSGQLPIREGALPATGSVGEDIGQVPPSVARDCARQCALNAIGALRSVVPDLDRVERVVKVVGFVASDAGFTGQPGVVDGASELFAAAFGEAGRHARSSVGVTRLPMDAPVEVEAVFAVAD